MADNNIEVKVKLVADKASAAEVQSELNQQLAVLEKASGKMKGKKGAKTRLNFSDIQREAANLANIDPTTDTERYNLALKKINEKMVSFIKGLYLSLQRDKKVVGEIEDVEKEIESTQAQLNAAKSTREKSQNEYDNLTDSEKTGFRVSKFIRNFQGLTR